MHHDQNGGAVHLAPPVVHAGVAEALGGGLRVGWRRGGHADRHDPRPSRTWAGAVQGLATVPYPQRHNRCLVARKAQDGGQGRHKEEVQGPGAGLPERLQGVREHDDPSHPTACPTPVGHGTPGPVQGGHRTHRRVGGTQEGHTHSLRPFSLSHLDTKTGRPSCKGLRKEGEKMGWCVSLCSVVGVGVHAGIYSGIMAASTRRQCNVNLR